MNPLSYLTASISDSFVPMLITFNSIRSFNELTLLFAQSFSKSNKKSLIKTRAPDISPSPTIPLILPIWRIKLLIWTIVSNSNFCKSFAISSFEAQSDFSISPSSNSISRPNPNALRKESLILIIESLKLLSSFSFNFS